MAVAEIHQLASSGALIKLAGFVGRHPVVVLLDSGATGNFVSSSFVEKHGLAVESSRDTIKGYDGRSEQSGGTLRAAQVRIDAYPDPMDLTVVTLSGYDVILGMPWHEQYQPRFDWRGKSVPFADQHNRRHVLRRAPTGPAVWQPTGGGQAPSSVLVAASILLAFARACCSTSSQPRAWRSSTNVGCCSLHVWVRPESVGAATAGRNSSDFVVVVVVVVVLVLESTWC